MFTRWRPFLSTFFIPNSEKGFLGRPKSAKKYRKRDLKKRCKKEGRKRKPRPPFGSTKDIKRIPNHAFLIWLCSAVVFKNMVLL